MTSRTMVSRTMILLALGMLSHIAVGQAAEPQPVSADELVKGDLLAAKAFRVAAASIRPSLVYIESIGGVPANKGEIGGIRRAGDGPTTGVVISADGYIVTSTFNFIRKPPIITAYFHDGRQRVAKLVGRDVGRRICLLKVEDVEDLPVPEFVPRAELKVGQWAISIGVGYGDKTPAISAGIISAKSRINGRAVQTDANTSPANYGGPLIDIEGRVIGICVPLSPQSTKQGSGVEWYDSGIGFAVPLHGEDTLLAALKSGKTIRPGYLGIAIKQDHKGPGVAISKILTGQPAAKAGLKANDIVLTIDEKEVNDPAGLKFAIGGRMAGETVKLTVKRGDENKEFEVKLAAAPAQPAATPKPKR